MNSVSNKRTILLVVILIFIIAGIIGYGEYRHSITAYKLIETQNEFASTTVSFENKITQLTDRVSSLEDANTSLNDVLQNEVAKSNAFEEQIAKVTDTVGTLDQLSKTDPQLLQKYSKVYFLNEHYSPSGLTNIESIYLFIKDKPLQIHTKVWPFLQNLLKDANATSTGLQIISAYRSFGTQTALKTEYKYTYGISKADQFSADQGYSEHQLGTTVDFTTPAVGSTFTNFENSSAYQWLTDNAYKYGYILSYPKNNKYYQYEPWHWRFVGIDLATRLHNENKYFYDMDQREIDTYLSTIFNP